MPTNQDSRIIIVSNRLPIVLKKSINLTYKLTPASGGLVTAIKPVLARDGGIWVGWAGNYMEEKVDIRELLSQETHDTKYQYEPVDISVRDYELYYKGFSNEILWPLFHNLSVYCKFKTSYYKAFKRVNRQFASTVTEGLNNEDFIWIHDYHLINVGEELRKDGIKNKIAFFLHIPFPPLETFYRLPWRIDIVNALLSYDLVGFQTDIDKKNFLEVASALTKSYDSSQDTKEVTVLTHENRECKVGVFPISIDYHAFSSLANSEKVTQITDKIKDAFVDQKIILGIDRLDYSKGIPHKLKAYRALLENNPQLHNKVNLIQVMVPSREDILKYSSLKSEIEELIGEINGKFSQLGWIPLQYYYHSFDHKELLAYYRAADIMLITPLRDGMNLVAKEYCAANIEKQGVLVLSNFAGTSHQLKEDALIINPFDEDSIIEALKSALVMPPQERQRRMQNMQNNVKEFNIYWWVDTFLKAAKQY